MFHLFGKIYLDLDHRLQTEYDRVVISATRGVDLSEDFVGAFHGELLYNTTDFDAFFPQGWVTLLKKLKNENRKVIVYCERDAYVKLIASWYRNIVPNLPYDLFKSFFYTQVLREVCKEEDTENLTKEPVPFHIEEKEVRVLYRRSEPLEEIQQIIKSKWSDISIEFHILEYLTTGVYRHFGSKIPFFVSRYFSELAREIRGLLILNAYSKQQQAALGYRMREMEYRGDIVEEMDAFKYLVGSRLRVSQKSLQHLTSAEVDELCDELRRITIEYEGTDPAVVENVFRTAPLMKVATSSVEKEHVDLFLDAFREARLDSTILPYGDLPNINSTLIHLLLNLSQQDLDDIKLCR